MIAAVGILVIFFGLFQIASGASIESNAESAFHQIYAATVTASGVSTIVSGLLICAVGSPTVRHKGRVQYLPILQPGASKACEGLRLRRQPLIWN